MGGVAKRLKRLRSYNLVRPARGPTRWAVVTQAGPGELNPVTGGGGQASDRQSARSGRWDFLQFEASQAINNKGCPTSPLY